jgi:hypothetical protein
VARSDPGFSERSGHCKGDVINLVRARAQGPDIRRDHGTLELWGGGALCFDLAVRVYSVQLPDVSPPLAITFAPHDFPAPETKEQQAVWRIDYP